jgi:hypothetical protein
MLQYISSNFRTLDLKSEEAMVGDLVVYYGAANHPEHMAVVSAVDERGVPTRVFSKMGRELKFVDSPIDEVWLGLGFAWQVMRFVD